MAKKCEHCGSELLPDGLCPKCDIGESQFVEGKSVPKLPPKEIRRGKDPTVKTVGANRTPEPPKRRPKWPLIAAAVLLAMLLTAGVLGLLTYFNVTDIPLFNNLFAALDIPKHYGQHAVIYQPPAEAAELDEKTGVGYINNIVLIFFKEGTSEEEATKVIESIDGQVVGKIELIDQYQVMVKTSSLDELEALCEQLRGMDCVDEALYDKVVTLEDNLVPNDPWEKEFTGVDETWSPEHPNGSNWWVDAVDAEGAWEYNDRLAKIGVGVMDNGVDYTHDELKDVVKYVPEVHSKEEHGTHVAGIIAAAPNNDLGITGLVWNCDMYTWDWELSDQQKLSYMEGGKSWSTTNQIYAGTVELIERGAKVVNFSLGQTASMKNEYRSEDDVNAEGKLASAYLCALLERGFDFVIVQSAGNGNAYGVSIDATYNGLFCSINENNCTTSDTVSADDIINRVIVVGAAQNDGDCYYSQTSWSNAGPRVDICGPGYAIYSTVPGSYDYLSGTSMSAPIVSGVAALTWAANETLTGADVKAIVCNPDNTKYDVADNTTPDHPLVSSYRMVNAQLCIEAAFNAKQGSTEPYSEPTQAPTEPVGYTEPVEPYTYPNDQPYTYPDDQPYTYEPVPTEPVTTRPRDDQPWSWGKIVNNGSCDIVMVLDNSSSMKGDPIEYTKEAAYAFAQNVISQNANVGIVAYNKTAESICDLTANLEELKAKIYGIETHYATNIEKGLIAAQEMLAASSAERKIIVLMSDGVPNLGKLGDDLVAYSDTLKSGGITIFTLGFFTDLKDAEIVQAQYLMEKIASTGYHYEIDETHNLSAFFGDIADVINGQKYIYMRVAGPADITVSYGSESLCSIVSRLSTRASFGTLGFEAQDAQQADSFGELGEDSGTVKVLRLKDGINYRIRIDGSDQGNVNFSIGYMDENGSYADLRKFEEVPIIGGGRMDTVAGTGDKTTLKVDRDGDGNYDHYYEAGMNETAHEISAPSNFNFVWVIAIGLIVLIILAAVGLIVFFVVSGRRRKPVPRPYC